MLCMGQQHLLQTPKVCGVTILWKSRTWCELHTAVDTLMYI